MVGLEGLVLEGHFPHLLRVWEANSLTALGLWRGAGLF